MNYSGSADSSTTSSTFSPGSEPNLLDSFESNLWKRCGQKEIKSDLQLESEELKHFQKTFSDALTRQSGRDSLSLEPTWNQQDPLALHGGLEAIASSLSVLTNTLGMALEEQRHYVQSKASDLMYNEAQGSHQIKSSEITNTERHLGSPPKIQMTPEKWSAETKIKQMKAPREMAMAMATKAKLLLRELKGVKQDLVFAKERCSQLEEENKRLRESIDKGVRHEEDDLVRLQLEALLTEKARLAQENATFARENQFLHEVVQYHQLKLRELAITDESLAMDDELDFDAQGVAMDLLPLYPDENDYNNDVEKCPSEWQASNMCS